MNEIKLIQSALNAHGFPCTVDGIFGPKTEAAVKEFQTNNDLTADGIFGPLTKAKLGLAGAPPASAPTNWDGSFVLGYDVAHYQSALTAADWVNAHAKGIRFMYPKAIDGVSGPDSSLARFKKDAKAASILSFAGYGFNRFSIDPRKQAEKLVEITQGVQSGELPHVIDDEWSNTSADASRYGNGKAMDAAAEDHIFAYLSRVEELSGVTPWHYTSNGFFRARNPERFARFPLILANYSSRLSDAQVPVPAPWKRETMRQYSGSLSTGHASEIDGDRFLGTLDQLKAYVKQ
jgi:GH25 family lysozyme M1 (1,4-beta-N-acetylmuramidase)